MKRLAGPLGLCTILVLAACGKGTPAAEICSPGTCGTGRACVVGRCHPSDASPSPADTQRVLLSPRDLAVLASRGASGAGADLPAFIALGREGEGNLVVLLRFAATWRDDSDVVSAFLLLDPLEGAIPPSNTIPVEVARILDPWSPSTVSWGRQPRLALPETAAVVRPQPPRPLRVDVTAMVRAWKQRRADDHGIALLTAARDPFGSSYSTGVTGGVGPRLEVYVR
jgi:hypothetical protein